MKIAVIGSGISGLSSAYYLSKKYKVDVYEKEHRLGGHARTTFVEDGDKKLFTAQVAGKNYWLESLAEEQQASDAIARLLRFNYASVPKDEDIEDEGLAGALGDEEIDVNVDVEPAVPESVEDL